MPAMPSWIPPRLVTPGGRLGGERVDFKSSGPFNGDGYRCGKDGHWGQGQAPRSEPRRPGEGACRSRSARQAARKRRQARPTNVTAQDGRRPPQEGVQEVGKEAFSCVPERDKHRGNSATSTSSPTLDVRSDARQLIPPRVGVVRQVANARAAHPQPETGQPDPRPVPRPNDAPSCARPCLYRGGPFHSGRSPLHHTMEAEGAVVVLGVSVDETEDVISLSPRIHQLDGRLGCDLSIGGRQDVPAVPSRGRRDSSRTTLRRRRPASARGRRRGWLQAPHYVGAELLSCGAGGSPHARQGARRVACGKS